MDTIFEAIGDAIHDFFVDACGGMFVGIFDDANASVANVSKDVALTPAEWNKSIFSMIQNLSNNVIIPIAGLIITAVLCYELITTITEKNNMHDVETFIFFKFCFKACVAVMLLSHTFEITMAIFDVGQWIVNKSAASIANDTYVNVNEIYLDFRSSLDKMDTGSLIVLMLEAAVVGLAVKAIAILVTVVLTNRMIEIYMYCSVAPIPFATMTNREWGNIGTNYIRSLVALAFQAFFIMVLVGIYSALVKDITTVKDLHGMLMRIGGYSIVLCLTLFKTSSISKSIFNAR
ncbi:VirB6/TrbL-like conjugal transfer protein, CD1112 family [Ruminococcus sp.]